MSILVAGIGNVFLGDDGFGVEVVSRLRSRALPGWLHVVDFGIRGFDLTYALLDRRHEATVFVDLVPGEVPGALHVIAPEVDDGEPDALDAHGMDPVKVLRLARALGGASRPVRIVGCEPLDLAPDDVAVGLSPPVAAAVEPAAALVIEVATRLREEVLRA